MNALIIYAHPNPGSFNAALAGVAEDMLEQSKINLKVKDIYGLEFNPVLSEEDFKAFHTGHLPEDIQAEQADVKWADLLIIITPVWWYSFPAILKGYIDRVFSIGFAYQYDSDGPHGMLGGKKVLVITTSGAEEETAISTGMLEVIRTMVNGIFNFCGFDFIQYENYYAVPTVTDQERKGMLNHFREILKTCV